MEILQSKLISTPRMDSGDSQHPQASKGHLEALELLDGDKQRYNGQGVQKAPENIDTILSPDHGTRLKARGKIDRPLIELDGTDNRSNRGANAILGVSLTLAKGFGPHCQLPAVSTLSRWT